MNWRNLQHLAAMVTAHFGRAHAVRADLVVGIPRSGMLVAAPLSLLLDLPLADLDGFCAGRAMRRNRALQLSGVRRVLLVDDSTNSGKAMTQAVATVRAASPKVKVTTLAAIAKLERVGSVDLHFDVCPGPRVFQWNLWRNEKIARFAFDIDGVLCRDPTGHENDDGPRYEHFLRTVEPWHLPKRPVGWLVTSRLEKYRALTEEWLRRHGVQYGQLVMLDLPSKAARLETKAAVPFKVETYQRVDARVFVESCRKKARAIARATGRCVLSIEDMTMIGPAEAVAEDAA